MLDIFCSNPTTKKLTCHFDTIVYNRGEPRAVGGMTPGRVKRLERDEIRY
jgi:hypothetical protein